MSLITCPDCEQRVSPHAPACPHCGRPISAPRPAFAERPAYGEPPPAYGAQAAYGEPSPAYGAQPGYATPPAYAARPGAWAPDPLAEQKQSVQIAYGLYAGSYLFGPLVFVALIMCYMKRGSIKYNWLDAHYDWLIDTFWMSLGGGIALIVVALLMMLVSPVGFLSLIVVVLAAMGWPIYRLVIGYTALTNGRTPEGRISPPRW